MNQHKEELTPCPVCGKERSLGFAPFPFEPDIPICADCLDAVWRKAGCAHWEDGCCGCPLWNDGYGEWSCDRKPFPLHLIGYDPDVVYIKSTQLEMAF